MKNSYGFSIIELMVTLALAAVLLAVGVPKLSTFFEGNRMVTNVNALVSAIQIARSEAIKRGNRVTVCKSANADAGAPKCTTAGDWEQGWIVFEDVGGNADYNAGDTILRRQAGVEGKDTTITVSDNLIKDYVMFTSRGVPKTVSGAAQSGMFRICDARGVTSTSGAVVARGVVLNAAGRVRLSRDAATIGGC
jgi:type IV fimbrial biogenesis protein FimT